jgi:guanosine-3',5'-bis(diphosphate) 3'-pyrophosphohydrolase
MEAVLDLEAEKKEILRRYRKLLRTAKSFLKEGDAKLIKKAFSVSMTAHQGMRRKSGEPYIYHPLAVAQIVVEEIGLGPTAIVAALLHDVVEDTEMEIEDIQRDFGPKIARIIDGLTKISGVFEYGTSQQAENFRKMLLTLSDDVRVILIKLADRLHNMRTLDSMPRNNQLKIASETMYLYAPLAHRLGLNSIKTELEDLYLRYTESETYQQIVGKLKETKAARERFIKEFIHPIEKELQEQEYDFLVKGRPKSIYSIWNKMRKQKIPFEEIYDLFAIRIILDTDFEHEKAACWHIYSIVTDYYTPNPDRLRDWISTPRANGYESLHTTVMSKSGQWVEVQIRTRRMDEIAEKGYAAHWKYKESGAATAQESGLDAWIQRVREMLESDNKAEAIEFVEEFRDNLFTDEVFVFTPKGELRTLPNGATALDFAFDIHSHIGFHCMGAKVNQKLVPLNYILRNGDQVEILTSKKQFPNEDWLKFVVTSKAKVRIREYLKEDEKRYIELGREITDRKLHLLKLNGHPEILIQLRAYFNCRSINEFHYKMGKGLILPQQLKKFKTERIERYRQEKDKVVDNKSFEKELTKIRGVHSDMLLIGEDMDKIDYVLAKCCNPIPGDDVFGFVTVNEGIKIHRTTCPNAVELMSNYGYRIIKAKWTSQQELAFLAGIRITGSDRVGLVNDVTRIISNELKVNMRSITIDTDGGMFEGQIMLFVHDTRHLDILIEKLKKVSGIVNVVRFDN